eukprot:gnl/TRDRNA2_/TRDRNA2_189732_c0_seq1.p1 gnl/TRDRNA2_/TRDRNA2_189732_c0~~gnl/TRDRNA2_/TRDRNA2_189732_c0_seq1.p1  ORF type:complete len:288 (-),score=83.70 gnl/TRDRNA2_/TRDRNA2_189732_c0_seq1:141-1004(-)
MQVSAAVVCSTLFLAAALDPTCADCADTGDCGTDANANAMLLQVTKGAGLSKTPPIAEDAKPEEALPQATAGVATVVLNSELKPSAANPAALVQKAAEKPKSDEEALPQAGGGVTTVPLNSELKAPVAGRAALVQKDAKSVSAISAPHSKHRNDEDWDAGIDAAEERAIEAEERAIEEEEAHDVQAEKEAMGQADAQDPNGKDDLWKAAEEAKTKAEEAKKQAEEQAAKKIAELKKDLANDPLDLRKRKFGEGSDKNKTAEGAAASWSRATLVALLLPIVCAIASER